MFLTFLNHMTYVQFIINYNSLSVKSYYAKCKTRKNWCFFFFYTFLLLLINNVWLIICKYIQFFTGTFGGVYSKNTNL